MGMLLTIRQPLPIVILYKSHASLFVSHWLWVGSFHLRFEQAKDVFDEGKVVRLDFFLFWQLKL
jgi:hypothetical protein